MQACGVCHTDLHYREGGISDDFPFLLGHEAAGIVEEVGEGVTDVAAGRLRDPQLARGLRECRACLRGGPWYCFATHNATQKMTLADGTELSPRSASAPSPTRPWSPPASARRSSRPRQPEVAGLLGCGVMAGLGAASTPVA